MGISERKGDTLGEIEINGRNGEKGDTGRKGEKGETW